MPHTGPLPTPAPPTTTSLQLHQLQTSIIIHPESLLGEPILHGTCTVTRPRLWSINITPQPAQALLATDGWPPAAPALILPDSDDDPLMPPFTAPTQPPLQTPVPLPIALLTPPLPVAPTHQRSLPHVCAYDLPSTPPHVAYLHAMADYPVKTMWLTAIKHGYYRSWPRLAHKIAARYCPGTDETHRGHMAQLQQHVHSTQTSPP